MDGATHRSNQPAGGSPWGVFTVVILLLVAVLMTGIVLFFREFRSATEDVTDPNRYGSILSEFGYPVPATLNIPRIDLFPAQIPSDATNIRLFYRPHFLQGGAVLQLRFNEPMAQIDAIMKSVQARAKENYSSSATSRSSIADFIEFRDAANQGFADLPADFQIYVIDSKKTSVDTRYAIGAAISRDRREIIYWLQD
jgi:hypothetical protein